MTSDKAESLQKCRALIGAYQAGELGEQRMPEDSNPGLDRMTMEEKISFFSLSMALNYQRNSYKLWVAARETWEDESTHEVFVSRRATGIPLSTLRAKLLKHKLALQPKRHIYIWRTISAAVAKRGGRWLPLFESAGYDFRRLKKTVQVDDKKEFPYLSGPKIFNYWNFILKKYAGLKLAHNADISIAPDTHVIQSSVRLGVMRLPEVSRLSREQIAERWEKILVGTDILPIDMHSPLWFWSRGGFKYKV